MSAVVWPHRASPLERGEGRGERGKTMEARPLAAPGRVIRIVMAGGGTGGHLYPGLAVAEALQELVGGVAGTCPAGQGESKKNLEVAGAPQGMAPGLERKLGPRVELIWAATPRSVDQRLLSGFGERYIQQPVQPLVKKMARLWPFWRAWRKSCAFWRDYFAKNQVDAILALGGYAAGPAAFVGGKLGVPVALLNPDALPGLANRFLLGRVDRVFSQWPLSAALAQGIRGRVMPLGCPIRPSLLARGRNEAATLLGLKADQPTLVVCGGSLAAKTINEGVAELLKDQDVLSALSGKYSGMAISGPASSGEDASGAAWQIIHLAGTEQAATVKAAYEPIKGMVWKVMDYCDDMASVWAMADLAIARAGASTCAELTACGVPAILLPYPYHRDQHQRHNAQQLVDAGAAVLVEDQKDALGNARKTKEPLLSLLRDALARKRMAGLAKLAGKPNAAQAIAEELLALVKAR